ncbi:MULTISPECIES: hypothetical protein [Streptomyces]|uniref:Uncharacterized protein n=1 Tax=Streptomyces doudnae TaxID=3075536 RepID=A0ABD5ELI9_9ACTN|nr:hypothetical protein [Streptomyces sp. DSM 41981]MDT0434257.1 hypothetical protein [Streptomyces sp. DSM 41981]
MGRRHGHAVVVSGAAVALLCGMPGARAATEGPGGTAGAAAPGHGGTAVAAQAPGGARGRDDGGDGGGLWPALPGLAVGLGLGVGGSLLMRRAAGGPGAGQPRRAPRQERRSPDG